MRRNTAVHPDEHLLAYVDGELSPDEAGAVEAHLVQCPQCAAQVAALRELGQGLTQTIDAAMAPVRLSREADDRIRAVLRERVERRERSGWFKQLWGRRVQVGQAALAMVLVVFSVSTFRVLSLPTPAAPQEVLVLGEDRLAPGSRGALRVVVRAAGPDLTTSTGAKPALAGLRPRLSDPSVDGVDLAGGPVADARVAISLLTSSGAVVPLFAGVSDGLGTVEAAFTVPEVAEGPATLVVETETDAGTARLEQAVAIARSYKVYLMTDKPAYRPGQVLLARALALDATTLLPAVGGAAAARMTDPNGDVVCEAEVRLSEEGVGAWSCELPDDAKAGTRVLSVALGDTVTERAIEVSDYELPAFSVQLATDLTYYGPGDKLRASVEAVTFFGMPVAGADVAVRLSDPGAGDRVVSESLATADSQGRSVVDLVVPASPRSGALTLTAEVVDAAGQRGGVRQTVVVAAEPLRVRAVPESGVLKPGVANDVYLMVTMPDGRPADVTLSVQAGDYAAELATGELGLAVMSFIPGGPTTLEVKAEGAAGRAQVAVELPVETAAQSLLLHTGQAVYEVGETLVATVLAGGDGIDIVTLDVVRASQLVAALSAPVVDGAATFALDLDQDLVGTLELRAATLAAPGPQDSRLVVVDPPTGLRVDLGTDRDRYAPGDLAKLELTTSEDGSPTSAVLGISVVDASVLALDTLPADLARAYVLAGEKVMARRGSAPGLSLPSLLGGVSDAEAAQDLAAKAAWAGTRVPEPSLQARSELVPTDEAAESRQRLAGWVHVLLVLLPAAVIVSVAGTVRRSGLAAVTLKRTGLVVLGLVVVSPVLVVGLVVGLLVPALGATVFFAALVGALALLLWLVVHGWRRPSRHARRFAAFLLAYLVLGGLALTLAAVGAEPGGGATVAIVGSFLLLILGVVIEGQVLLVERSVAVGWATTVLALVLAALAVTAPSVPAFRSGLASAAGDPGLYLGPMGWLSGCSMAAPEATEEPAAEEPELPAEVEATEAPLPQPTASPAPTATVAGQPVLPAEPYPLRQVFPETLYWDPEARTDAQGRLAIDLALADSVTTWQVTVLASTRDGAIGAASLPLVVSQDLVLDVDVPDVVRVREAVTVTLNVYNTAEEGATVVWDLPDEVGFDTVRVPASVVVAGGSGATATWVIRPDHEGVLALQIGATGETSGDLVLVEVVVKE